MTVYGSALWSGAELSSEKPGTVGDSAGAAPTGFSNVCRSRLTASRGSPQQQPVRESAGGSHERSDSYYSLYPYGYGTSLSTNNITPRHGAWELCQRCVLLLPFPEGLARRNQHHCLHAEACLAHRAVSPWVVAERVPSAIYCLTPVPKQLQALNTY